MKLLITTALASVVRSAEREGRDSAFLFLEALGLQAAVLAGNRGWLGWIPWTQWALRAAGGPDQPLARNICVALLGAPAASRYASDSLRPVGGGGLRDKFGPPSTGHLDELLTPRAR